MKNKTARIIGICMLGLSIIAICLYPFCRDWGIWGLIIILYIASAWIPISYFIAYEENAPGHMTETDISKLIMGLYEETESIIHLTKGKEVVC